jgi:hypothetical protein
MQSCWETVEVVVRSTLTIHFTNRVTGPIVDSRFHSIHRNYQLSLLVESLCGSAWLHYELTGT